jgi:lysophospholipid hydrolase
VEGTVQVFAQTDHSPEVQQSVWDDEDLNGYQLLNEVGSGGTLSSLFTILSLFTEDVQMSWQDDDSDLSTDSMAEFDEGNPLPPRNRSRRANSDVSPLRFEREPTVRRFSNSSETSTVHARGVKSPSQDGSISPNQDVPIPSTPMPSSRHHHPGRRLTQVRRGVVARATVDTTLAVIPAEAFRRLTKKFPKATGHIVQGNNDQLGLLPLTRFTVILTRFTRVTFNAAHKYLGLTSEVLRTEKAINDIACHPLPTSFYEGGGLQYLRHRFDEGNTSTSDSEGDYFSASPLGTLSPVLQPIDASTPSLGNLADKSNPIRGGEKQSPSRSSRSSRHLVQAGDLLVSKSVTNDPTRPVTTRTFSVLNTPNVPYFGGYDDGESSNKRRGTSRWLADDFDLREEVMSCIAKSIGLLQPPLSGSDSPPSPPPELRRASTSAFGSLSLLDLGDDMSSVTAGSSVHSSGNYLSGLDNEVEILFYAAGTTLAKAGESNTGNILLLNLVTSELTVDVI